MRSPGSSCLGTNITMVGFLGGGPAGTSSRKKLLVFTKPPVSEMEHIPSGCSSRRTTSGIAVPSLGCLRAFSWKGRPMTTTSVPTTRENLLLTPLLQLYGVPQAYKIIHSLSTKKILFYPLARENPITFFAPSFLNTLAHSCIVAPEVYTSSTSKIFFPDTIFEISRVNTSRTF